MQDSKPTILLLETISPDADQLLRQHVHILRAQSPSQGIDAIAQNPIHGIVTRGKGKVNKTLIDACTDLRVIARCGVGLDNIDLETATTKGIPVFNTPGANASTVAEHTMALILNLSRHLFLASQEVKSGHWAYRNRYAGDEISGKTIGILGMGNIGQRVARLCAAFGMNVLFWDAQQKVCKYEQTDLGSIWEKADIISIHLPLVDSTKGLICQTSLAQMKRQPILINTARGGIVKDADVLEALESGQISGFGADVLETGVPPQDFPLLSHPRVIVTPHTASLTQTTYRQMCLRSVQNVITYLQGKPVDPMFVANKEYIDLL